MGNKNYIKDVSEITIDWVLELCPHFYKDTRKEYQQEKYKNESKMNTKRAKELVQQDQRLKESQKMMESRSEIMKKPESKKKLNFFSSKKKSSTSGMSAGRVRKHDLAPMPKDVDFDPTKLDKMFPNKKQKRNDTNTLSFADDEY